MVDTSRDGEIAWKQSWDMEEPLISPIDSDPEATARTGLSNKVWTFLATAGPGIMVCLADSDGPGLITAAQSGAEFRYSLLLTNFILIPILFVTQGAFCATRYFHAERNY